MRTRFKKLNRILTAVRDCLKTGDTPVRLRLCMTCGHIGCCGSSKNKHATKRFHSAKHPIMKSIEPGEDWGWCYVDEVNLISPEWLTFPFPD